jgi:GH18 family chitinase
VQTTVDDIPAGLLSRVIFAFANVTAVGDCDSGNATDNCANSRNRWI